MANYDEMLVKVVETLNLGADVNATDNNGSTALKVLMAIC